jgi:threonine/homoserine/homoserine lactone efflux protein
MFLTFAIALFILCMKPGPDMAAVISRALNDGFGAASALIFGTITAELIYLWAVSYGFFIFADHIDLMQLVFQSIGAALFIYLGVKGFFNLDSGIIKQQKQKEAALAEYAEDIRDYIHIESRPQSSKIANFTTGLMVCLGNPIIMLFYATAYPAMIDLTDYKIFVIYICSLLVIFCNGGPLFVIAYMAGKMRHLLKNEKTVRIINSATSLIFVIIGLIIGFSAIF